MLRVFLPYAFPAFEVLLALANSLSEFIPSLMCLLVGAYCYLIGQYKSSLSIPFTKQVVQYSVLLVSVIAAVTVYLWQDTPVVFYSFDPIRFGLSAIWDDWFNWLWIVMWIVHIYVLVSLYFFYRQTEPDSPKGRQSRVYVMAYFFRFVVLGGAITFMACSRV